MATKEDPLAGAKRIVSGGVAGCVSRTAVAPLERLKILYQVQDLVKTPAAGAGERYGGVTASLARIWREEGMRGMFRGNGTNVVRVFPYTATQFYCFEAFKPYLMEEGKTSLDPLRRLAGGAMAGIVSVVLTYPLDFVRARLTAQGGVAKTAYRGIWHCLTTTVRQEGVLRLYRGISPTILGVAPYTGLNFMVFETIKQKLPVAEGEKGPSVLHMLAAGAVAGSCGQTAAYPFDLLRRRFQMQGVEGSTVRYNSTLHGFRTIVAEEGALGLYKGIMPNFIKVVPSIAVMFVTNEMLKRVML